jgi:hypothetical protein
VQFLQTDSGKIHTLFGWLRDPVFLIGSDGKKGFDCSCVITKEILTFPDTSRIQGCQIFW